MTSSLKTALTFLALGTLAAPAVAAQERAPRAGAPIAAVAMIETAPVERRPRSGAPIAVAAPSTEYAIDANTVVIVDTVNEAAEIGLCGRKYCGAAYAR